MSKVFDLGDRRGQDEPPSAGSPKEGSVLRESPAYHANQGGSPIQEYWYFILKRKWLFLLVWGAVVASTIVYTRRQQPEFAATALLEIRRARLKVLQDVIIDAASESQFYGSQETVLRSRTLAERVVTKLSLWQHPIFNGANPGPVERPANLQPLADRVRSMLRVSLVSGTQVMRVSFHTPDPALCAALANTLVNEYVVFSSLTATTAARNTASFINEQIKKLQDDIREKERLLQDYSKKLDILQGEKVVVRQLDSLNTQLTEAQGQRASAEARYKSLADANQSSLAEVMGSSSIAGLRQQYEELRRQHAELSARFKPDWPALQRLEHTMQDVKKRLDEESASVAANMVAAARVEYEVALKREALLRSTLDERTRAVQSLNAQMVEYERVKMELDNQRLLLQELLRQQSEAGLSAELGEREPVNLRVVEEALPPTLPYKPDMQKNLLMGTVAGLCLAVGLVFSLRFLSNAIFTADDVKRYASLPYLGMVPRHRLPGKLKSETAGSSLTRLTLAALQSVYAPTPTGRDSPTSPEDVILAERIKFLRGALLHPPRGAPPRTLMVTSPDKHAGKTFLACNLAVSLATRGRNVLLVDTDLRIPRLHRIFNRANDRGLTSVLASSARIDFGSIAATQFSNLFLLPAGPKSDCPAELIDSASMDQLLRSCVEHFDFVVLDSAPLLPVADSIPLTKKCDAVLLVVRSGDTPGHAVRASVEVVERMGGKLTGVVLNDVNLRDLADLFYHARYTYEYGSYYSQGKR